MEPTSWEIFLHTHRRTYSTFMDKHSRLIHEQMEAYFEEAMIPFEDGTMSRVPLLQDINRQFMMVTGSPNKGKLYVLSTIASTIYLETMDVREGLPKRGNIYMLHVRKNVNHERTVEARQECQEQRLRVSSYEELVRLLLSGMSRGSHIGYSSRGRGSSQLVMGGSPHTGKSSQGSNGSPLEKGTMAGRSSHISRSLQGRASSNHVDTHLTRADGDDGEYDDDETQP